MKTVNERFNEKWESVTETGCWIWLANKTHYGYGRFNWDKKMISAHRASYRLYKGEIPEGLLVLHSCNTRLCVNPDHLRLGTHADNSQDMVMAGNSTQGEKHPLHKLTEQQVKSIKYGSYMTNAAFGNEFGIGESRVSEIKRGLGWKHL